MSIGIRGPAPTAINAVGGEVADGPRGYMPYIKALSIIGEGFLC